MPRNKDALIRYRVINRCLTDYTLCSKEKLKQACEDAQDKHPLGERTIAGDIHALGYGSDLRVIEPEELRVEIVLILEESRKNY